MTTKNRLTELKIEEISLVDSPANKEARSVLFKRDGPEDVDKAVSEDDAAYSCPDCQENFTNIVSAKAHMGSKHPSSEKPPRKLEKAVTKTENGVSFPKAAYAYTPSDTPSDWKIRLWASPDQKETAAQVGAAVAAIGKGFRGNKAVIPSADMPAVKAKVRAAWKKVNSDKDVSEIPDVLKRMAPKLTDQDLDEIRKEFEIEEEVAKDTLLFIDDDDDIVSDLRQLLGIDPPEEGEDDPLAQMNPGTPLYQVADALSVLGKIEKAGKKISADRMNRLKDAHGKLGQVIGEVDNTDAGAPDAKEPGGTGEAKTSTKKGKDGNMPTIEELQKQNEDLTAQLEELKKSPEPQADAEEDIFKGLTPAASEKLRGEIAKNEAMEKRIAKMEDEQENVEFTKQAKGLGLPNDFGPVLKRFSKNQSTPEDMEQLSGVFKAYNEAGHLAEVMREVGKAGPQGGTTAWDAIVAKGDEIRKAEPMLSAEQARSRAIEMEPGLKVEYDAERTGAAAA